MLTEVQVQQENARRKEVFEKYLHSREYQEKLIQRLKLLDAGERSVEARTYLWHLCARPDNPVEGAKFFINTFGWTLDPRPEHEPFHLPFITFEYQDRAIEWFIDRIDNGRDGLVEKSRDMGMSWLMFVWLPLWYWLFRDGTNILLGSYKEALVDDRTPDSLFGKIDYQRTGRGSRKVSSNTIHLSFSRICRYHQESLCVLVRRNGICSQSNRNRSSCYRSRTWC